MLTKVNTQAKVLTGIVNLEEEPTVVKVECPSKQLLRIYVKDTSEIKKWVPGTRFIIPEKLACMKGQVDPLFRLGIRRTLRTLGNDNYLITYEVEELELTELMLESTSTIQRTFFKQPTQKGNFSFTLFSWNWDSKNRQCANYNIQLYRDKYFGATCVECYAYTEAEIHVKIDFHWRTGLNKLLAQVTGNTKLHYDVLGEASYKYNKEFEKEIWNNFKAFKIAFKIGIIPVWIDFNFALKFKGRFDFSTSSTLRLSGTWSDKLVLGMEYDRNRAERWRFFKEHERSAWKDLLPRAKFDGKLDAKGWFTLLPEFEFAFYSTAGVKVTLIPYMDLITNGEVGNKEVNIAQCPRNQIFWDVAYGVNIMSQMQKLKLWKFKTDLGGRLPYPNPPKEYTIIPRSSITTGCFPITNP